MHIITEWYDTNRTVIIAKIPEDWTWGTAQDARNTIESLAESVSYSVSLIVVLPPDLSVPPGGFAENSRDALERHANAGLSTVIYVTRNPSTKTLWQSVIEMYANPSVKYGFAPTIEDAAAMV